VYKNGKVLEDQGQKISASAEEILSKSSMKQNLRSGLNKLWYRAAISLPYFLFLEVSRTLL
jgi:hypothetical protein